MAAVGKQRAAKNSRVTIVATNLNYAKWKAMWKGDDLDTTNFESLGEQGTIGVIVCEWSCGGDWDAGRNSYDSPPGLYPRDDLGSVKFYENVADNIFHTLATNRVISADNGADIKGKVSFDANGKSQGLTMSAALPTGSI